MYKLCTLYFISYYVGSLGLEEIRVKTQGPIAEPRFELQIFGWRSKALELRYQGHCSRTSNINMKEPAIGLSVYLLIAQSSFLHINSRARPVPATFFAPKHGVLELYTVLHIYYEGAIVTKLCKTFVSLHLCQQSFHLSEFWIVLDPFL